jgi:outer membrane protein
MDKDQTIVAFTVAQPLTPLFKVHEAVNIAKADERIAQAKAEKMAAEISTDVEPAYYALLIAQRQQSGAEAKSKMIESQLQLASTGTPPLGGMAERHAALLEVSKALVTANSKVTELTGSLNALIGFPPDTELELVAPEPVVETISLTQATQQAMATSPEVVEAEQTVVKARAATKLSKLDYIPDVAILGGYAYQTAVPLLPADFSFVGVVVSFNVFDFGKRERTASLRHTQLAMAEGNLELVKAKVAASVQKSFLELQRARQILDLTQQLASMVQQVPASYQSAQLEAQAVWAKAEADMFQAQLDYRLAYTQLKGVMGEK